MIYLHDLVAAATRRSPDAIAVSDDRGSLTFAELNELAGRLAEGLRSSGIGSGDRVVVALPRDRSLLVSVLGILRSGAAFVPCDPRLPARRLRLVADDAAAALIVTRPETFGAFADIGAPVETVGAILDAGGGGDAVEPPPEGDVAYVLYTSGSTGRPKGVAIRHRDIVGYFAWAVDRYEMSAGSGAPLFTSMGFDLTLTSLFGPLVAGRTVHAIDGGDEVIRLAEILRRRPDYSFVKLTPHHLDLLDELLGPGELVAGTRSLVVGGEQLWSDSVAAWHERAPGIRIFNEYGPTETVIGCVVAEATAVEASPDRHAVPIGEAVPGASAYVLDGRLQPVGASEAGELFIGGTCAGGWYVDRPGLTAERFVADPFGEPGSRIYRTGDRVRVGVDGLEYLGRVDEQVKIRGHRVEPAEVRAVLRSRPDTGEVVVYVTDGLDGHSPVLRAATTGSAEPADLRAWLAERLPDWMVPSSIVRAAALPLTVNGKIDIAALAADHVTIPPEPSGDGRPVGPAEQLLASLMSELLDRPSMSRHDDFFGSGGDSMSAIQLVARAQRSGLRLTPRMIVEHPTVAALALAAQEPGERAALPSNGVARRSGGEPPYEVPLTPIQRWFFGLDTPEPDRWNQSILLDLPAGVDHGLLREAVAIVARDRDALQLRFQRSDTGWRQVLVGGSPSVVVETRTGPLADELERAHAGLDITDGPLMRVVVAQGGPGPDRLLLVAHHLIVDTASWRAIVDDLAHVYAALAAGESHPDLAHPGHFCDWAVAAAEYSTGDEVTASIAHWRAVEHHDAHPLPRAAGSVDNGLAGVERYELLLDEHRVNALTEAMRAKEFGIREALIGSFIAAVCEVLGCPPPIVDVENHGREDLLSRADGRFGPADLSRTMGWFTALFPVWPGEVAAPAALIEAVATALRAAPAQGVTYGMARYSNSGGADLGCRPEILVNYLGRSGGVVNLPLGWQVSTLPAGRATGSSGARPYVLEYHPEIVSGSLRSIFYFHPALHPAKTMSAIAERTHQLLSQPEVLVEPRREYADSGLDDLQLAQVLSRYGGTT